MRSSCVRSWTAAALALTAFAAAPRPASAQITWSTATTIAGDTDVLNVGTGYAYTFATTAQTVNGVTFTSAGTSVGNFAGGSVTTNGFGGINTNAFGSTTATPFGSLSAPYRATIGGAANGIGAAGNATVFLNNLANSAGRLYVVQVWAGDPRGGNLSTRSVNLVGANTVTLNYGNAAAAGALGSYSLGTFTGSGPGTQTFNVTQPMNSAANQAANVDGQINAILVRDVTGVWSGAAGPVWDTGSVNFTGGMSFADSQAISGNVFFGDTDGYKTAVSAASRDVQVQAGGITVAGVATFQNVATAYTLQNLSGGVGLTGASALTKSGGGSLTLNGQNTYTGTTTLAGGTVSVAAAETVGTSGPLGNGGLIVFAGGALQATATNTFDYSARFGTQTTPNNQLYAIDTNGQNVTWASPLVSLNGALTKNGAGTLTLSGANTYAGATTLNAGTLVLSGTSNTPGAITLFGGTMSVTGSHTTASQLLLQNAAELSIAMGATETITGAGSLVIGNNTPGTSIVNVAGTLNIPGGIVGQNTAGVVGILNIQNGGVVTVAGGNLLIGNGGNSPQGIINLAAGGQLVLDAGGGNTNAFAVGRGTTGTGTINLDGGIISTARGVNTGDAAGGTSTFNFNGGTLRSTAVIATNLLTTTVANVRNGGAVVDTNGFNNTITTALRHSQIGTDNATDGGLTKTGAGTLTLTAAATYTGPTAITGGKLVVANAASVLPGAVSVGSGAVLASNATFGAISVADTGALEAGVNNVGSITTTSLSFAGAGSVTLGGLSNYATTAAVNISGPLSAGGAAGSIPITVATVGNPAVGATYKLFTYTGTPGGTGFAAFTLAPLPSHVTGVLVESAGQVGLNVTAIGFVVWTGAASTAWDTATQNWKLSTDNSPTAFAAGDLVLFDDTAPAANTAVAVAAAVSPGSVTFNNATNSYTLSGPAGITGAAAVTKNGLGTLSVGNPNSFSGAFTVNAGTVTLTSTQSFSGGLFVNGGTVNLNAAQAYTGGTVINGGVVKLGNATGLGTAANAALTFGPNAAAGTKLQLNGFSATIGALNTNPLAGAPVIESGSATAGTDTLTLSTTGINVFAGALQNGGARLLAFTKAGAGSLTLSGVNTHTGGTTLSAGTLNVNNVAALGTGTFSITGGTLDNTSGAAIALAAVPIAWNGGIAFTGTNDLNLGTGTVTSTAVRIATVNGGTLTFGGTFAGAGGVTKTGAGTLRLNGANTYTGATTIQAGTLVLAGTHSAAATLSLQGNSTINVTGTETITGAGALTLGQTTAGASVLNVSGTLNLNGTNDTLVGQNLTGANGTLRILSGGVVNVANGGFRLGNSGGTAGPTGTLTLDPGSAMTFDTTDTGFGFLVSNGAGSATTSGTVNLNGGVLTTGRIIRPGTGVSGTSTFNFNGGTLKAGLNSATFMAGLTAANVLEGGAILDSGTFAVTIPQPLLHGGAAATDGGLVVRGGGTLTLTGTSTFTGLTDVQAGTLALGSATALPTANSVKVSGGTLALGAFNATLAGVQLTGGSITGGTGVLTAATAYDLQAGSVGAILAGTVGVTKSTAGTVTLGGANTYTGGTAVNAGKLVVTGSLAPAGAVSVAGGATLGGSGSAGVATVAANGLVEAGAGGSGTLTLAGLNFSGAGTITIATLSNYAAAPGVVVTGGGAVNPAGGANSVTFNIASLGTAGVGSTYKLLGYTGGLGGAGFAAFKLGTPLPSRALGTLVNNAGEIDLTITALDSLKWTGTGTLANGWDTATLNWKLNSSNAATAYINTPGDAVIFDDSAAPGNTTVNLNALNVSPTSVTFNNTANNYTLQGTFGITGATSLVKSGGGSLTLANTNAFAGGLVVNGGTVAINAAQAFTGGVTINGGTVALGNANALNSNAVAFGANAPAGTKLQLNGFNLVLPALTTNAVPGSPVVESGSGAAGTDILTVQGAAASTFAGILQDGGTRTLALVKTGTGSLTLAGNNTFTGGTTLASGTLNLNGANVLGGGTFTITGGTLDNTSGAAVTLASTAAQAWNADFTFTGSNDLNLGTGAITLGGNRSVTVSAGNLTAGGIGGGAATLTKLGAGTLTLAGTNSYTGLTTVAAGQLVLPATSTTAASTGFTVGVTGVATPVGVLLAGGSLTINGYLYIGGSSFGTAISNVSTFTVTGGTLTVNNTSPTVPTDFILGQNVNGTAKTSQFTQTGGTVVINSSTSFNTSNGGGVSQLDLSGGTLTATNILLYLGVRGDSTLNVSNTHTMTVPFVSYGHPGTVSGNVAINLGDGTNFAGGTGVADGGTSGVLVTGAVQKPNTSGSATFNFNGGTLKARVASTAFFPGTNGNTATPGAIAAAVLDAGGAIDNNAFAITLAQVFAHGGVAATDGGLAFRGAGITTLTSAQTYNGPTLVQAGTLAYGNNDILNDAGTVKVTGGTLNLGAFNDTVAAVQLASGGIAGTGTLTSASTFDVRSGTASAILNGVDGTVGLTKTTAGTATLAGANAYSGPTAVTAGKLFVNGSINPASAVAVAGGATLGGGGSVGVVSVAAGGALEAGSGGSGTFTASDLTFAGSATIVVGTVANYGSSPGVTVTNTFAANGGANSVTITLGNLSGVSLNTPYKVLGYNGTIGGSGFAAFKLPAQLPNRAVASLVDNPNEIALVVTSTDSLKWTGTGNLASGWNTTTANWKLASNNAPTTYFDVPADSVAFDDSAPAANTSVVLSTANVSPSGVLFANDTNTYALSGAFGITGPTGVVKNGTGSLTISNGNSFAGGFAVNAGTVVLNASQAFGGGLAVNGGTVTINTAQAFTGGTTLAGGTLNLNHPAALGAGPLTITGGTLDSTGAAAVVLANGTAQTWAGDFAFTGTRDLATGTGTVTLTAFPTVTVNAGTLTVGGVISGSGLGITKAGPGTLVFAGGNSFSGLLTVNAGLLRVTAAQTISGSVLVNDGTVEVAAGGSIPAANQIGLFSATAALRYTVNGGTVGNTISGGGVWTLAPVASSDFAVTGNNTGFNGMLNINALARFNAHTASTNLPGAGTTINVLAGGQFYFGGYVVNSPITLAGAGWVEANGTLGAIRTEGGNVAGPVTLAANASIGAYRNTATITGTITGPFELEMRSGTQPVNDTITLSPSAQNTYGSTRVNNGFATTNGNIFLRAGNAQAFSTGGLVLGGTNASSLGILLTNGFDFTFANLSSPNAFGQVQNNSATPSTITVGTDNSSTAFSGSLLNGAAGGALAFIKVGTGTLTLAGANTYTGGTTVSAGTLAVNGSLDAATTVAVTAAGTLAGSGSVGVVTLAGGTIALADGGTIAGTLTVDGGSWTGQGGVTGATTVNSGTLTVGPLAKLTATAGLNVGNDSLLAGTGTVQGSVTYASTGSSTFAGRIAGASSTLTVSSGSLTLTGFNTYSGLTNLTGGTLAVNNSLSGPGGAINIAAGAVLQAWGSIQRNVVAVAGAPTAVVTATGPLTLGSTAAALDFQGTLNVGANAVAVVSGGASLLKYVTVDNLGTLGSSNGLTLRSLVSPNGLGTDITPGLIVTGGSATIDGNVSLGQSGVGDARTYIQVATGAVLHFSGVVKGSVTQVLAPGFNGVIQFDGLRKNGFSPGFNSYGSHDYGTTTTTFYLWGTTPAANASTNTTPYFSNDLITGAGNVGVLPGTAGGGFALRFSDEVAGLQYTPKAGDKFRILQSGGGAGLDNTSRGGLTLANLSFPDNILTGLNLKPKLVVVPGTAGYVELQLLTGFTWQNTTSDNTWGTDANWLGGTKPAANQVAWFDDNVTNAAGGTVTLAVGRTAGGLRFDSTATSYTVGGSATLTLSNTAGATLDVVSGTHAVTAAIQLSNSLTATVAGSGTLTLSGGLAETEAGLALTKAGAGTLVLNGANGYTGATNLTAGTLTINNSLSGPGGAINIAAGATLRANGTIQRNIAAVGNAATAAITATGGLTLGSSASTFDFSGTLNVGANAVAVASTAGSLLKYVTIDNLGTLGSTNGLTLRSLVSPNGLGTDITPGLIVTGGSVTVDGNVSLGQSGTGDARTYIKVADGAVLHFSGVVKGSVTQVLAPGFNGVIQFDGLRKNGFSPGFNSYGDQTYGNGTYFFWGTTPAANGTAASTPYFSNDLINGTGTLPDPSQASFSILFNDGGTTATQYLPKGGDKYRFIRASASGSIDNSNGFGGVIGSGTNNSPGGITFGGFGSTNYGLVGVAGATFNESLQTLNLISSLTVVEGQGGYAEVGFADQFVWKNAGGTSAFATAGNWELGSVPGVLSATTQSLHIPIFDNRVTNYNGGLVTLATARTLGGLKLADSGQGGYTIGGTATLTLFRTQTAGGSLALVTVLSGSHAVAAPVSLGSNVLVQTAASSQVTFSGGIGGSGKALYKSGPGTVVLTGTNSFNGGAFATAGTLKGSGSLASGVTVSTGATLAAGTGTGAAARTFTTGAVAFGTGSNFRTQLFSTTGGDMGQLASTGAVSFADGSVRFQLDLTGITRAALAAGGTQAFTVISAPTGGVSVASGSLGSSNIDLVNNTGSFTNSDWSLSPSANGVQLVFTPTAVPEPAAVLAAGAGVLGLGRWVRRRRAKR